MITIKLLNGPAAGEHISLDVDSAPMEYVLHGRFNEVQVLHVYERYTMRQMTPLIKYRYRHTLVNDPEVRLTPGEVAQKRDRSHADDSAASASPAASLTTASS